MNVTDYLSRNQNCAEDTAIRKRPKTKKSIIN